MAIVLQREKSALPWKLIIGIVAVLIIGGVVAYVFFASPTFFEIVPPSEVRQVSELSGITLDVDGVSEERTGQRLRQLAAPPTTGEIGRTNPFLEY